MAFVERECPECGDSFPVNKLRWHRRDEHGVEIAAPQKKERAVSSGDGFTKDDQPRPSKAAKQRAGRPPSVGVPIKTQIELVYRAVGTATRSRAPITSAAITAQAPACAAAWDNFLLRYPAVREMLEKGMIAGDILGLVMAHMPIAQAFREEMATRQLLDETYNGGLDGVHGQHVASAA